MSNKFSQTDNPYLKIYSKRSIKFFVFHEISEEASTCISNIKITGVARNFDWEEPKLENFLYVILVTFIGDVMVMTSLKWRHNYIFEIQFRHYQLQKPLFSQVTELQVINLKQHFDWGGGERAPWAYPLGPPTGYVLIKTYSAHEPDEILSKFVKLANKVLTPMLTKLFNKCIQLETFPDNFKKAYVISLPKVSSPKTLGDFSTISLLPIFLKLFEKLIETKMIKFINKN